MTSITQINITHHTHVRVVVVILIWVMLLIPRVSVAVSEKLLIHEDTQRIRGVHTNFLLPSTHHF